MNKAESKKGFVKDMTTGSVYKLLISFSIPMLIGNIFQQIYNTIDSMVVGKHVGTKALAAVGATGSLNFLFFSLCIGLTGGIGIVISQYFGAGDIKKVRTAIFNSIHITFLSALTMSIIGVCFARKILLMLNTPLDIIDDAESYLRITSAAILAVAAFNCVSSILRALGDTKTPLIFLIISSIINVILDLFFVIKLNLGVKGVAYATVISQILSAIGSFVFAISTNDYFRISKEERHYNHEITLKCYKLGLPLAMQSSLIAISCVALQNVVNTFGSTVVSAFTATSRIEQLIQQPFNSFGLALSTFTGQNIGARKLDRVKEAFSKSLIIITIISFSTFLIFNVFGCNIMCAFVNDEEVINLGQTALRITSLFYFSLGMIYIGRGLLNGAGDSVYAMINGMIEVAGRIIFANLLIMIPFVGKWGVWMATALTWFITGAASYIRYKQGKWKNIQVVSEKRGNTKWILSRALHLEHLRERNLLKERKRMKV